MPSADAFSAAPSKMHEPDMTSEDVVLDNSTMDVDAISDRSELIKRLKRGESPTWIPSRHQLDDLLPALSDVQRDSPDTTVEMERPRSALHSGDFKPPEEPSMFRHVSQPDPWDQPRLHPLVTMRRAHTTLAGSAVEDMSPVSPFAYRAPTSPLVQSELSESVPDDDQLALGPRRYTMVEWSGRRPVPYRAHQPGLSASPDFPRFRRPSHGESPMQHASMVGSYEESILRGRMSTSPSKPLEFVAQIGVLGLGRCRSALRCPPHVTLPFSAVFYHYPNTGHGRTRTDDGPSPYVGAIDLENGIAGCDDDEQGAKKKRRKAPPGGSYRIPERGQIQIVIKNQNKTAVKLFLVPYDLSGMEPGTKTFVRQRSYCEGGDDGPGTNEGTSTTTTNDTTTPSSNSSTRPTLRYLVHLQICSPSHGRFYLYKDVRVVFANRVPYGKERLRNDVMVPDPRFSPYKPEAKRECQRGLEGLLSP